MVDYLLCGSQFILDPQFFTNPEYVWYKNLKFPRLTFEICPKFDRRVFDTIDSKYSNFEGCFLKNKTLLLHISPDKVDLYFC